MVFNSEVILCDSYTYNNNNNNTVLKRIKHKSQCFYIRFKVIKKLNTKRCLKHIYKSERRFGATLRHYQVKKVKKYKVWSEYIIFEKYIKYCGFYEYKKHKKKNNNNNKNVQKLHVNSLAQMESLSACVLREGLMSFMNNVS